MFNERFDEQLNEKYRDAMNALPFDENFEEKMMKKLNDSMQTSAPKRARHKGSNRRIWLAAAACMMIMVVGIVTWQVTTLPGKNPTDQALTQSVQPTLTQAPLTINEILTDMDAQLDSASAKVDTSTSSDEMAFYESDPTGIDGTLSGSTTYGNMARAQLRAFPESMPIPLPTQDTTAYSSITENRWVETAIDMVSTFAADVDTASYADVRAILMRGATPDKDAVRIEEMINYFSYNYPEPEGGEPFSVTTEIAPCPWNDESQLLMVGLQAKKLEKSERPASNLVFLIDVSGSMDEPDKLPLVQRAFSMLVEQLDENDTVSIVTYAGEERVALDGARGNNTMQILGAVDSLFAYGSTNGEGGINKAYEIAQKHFIDGGNNRVILATDGDLNVGISSAAALKQLIEKHRQGGIFLSVIGVGQGNVQHDVLETLADNGNGNYSYIDSVLEARKVLVEEMGANFFTVCKDVKLQVVFDQAAVEKYRLIGYENRRLTAQDFVDDKVDAGEIGAGHSVTALYEVILTDAQVSEYAQVNIRAKAPDGDESKLYTYPVTGANVRETMSDGLRFAAAVAETGMILRESEFKGSATFASAAQLLEPIQDLTQDPYKDEFAYMLRQLARGV